MIPEVFHSGLPLGKLGEGLHSLTESTPNPQNQDLISLPPLGYFHIVSF